MEFKNDLGKPWKYQDGDYEVVRTSVWSPPGCHPVGCQLKLYVDKEGRLAKVEGDENDPVTNGRLCPRCLALKDYVYNPSRVVYPMHRKREDRGNADAWERITWDEAYTEIIDNWKRITDEYGKESMAIHVGTGRDGMLGQNFAVALFQTPNLAYTQSGYACYQPRSMSTNMVLGGSYPEMDYAAGLPGGYDDPEYVVPECIIVWGKAPLASNGDGLFGHAVVDLMKRGAKLIVVDPRVQWLATRAEYHLRVRPGTDCALAMAMCHVMITEDLYDHEWVENWCYGFDEFAERCATMPPEKAAEICEVSADDIRGATRLYATSKPASITWGLAFDQNQNGSQAATCVLALMAMSGNVDVPGGNIIGDMAPQGDQKALDNEGMEKENSQTRASMALGWFNIPEETRAKVIGGDKYPLYCSLIMGCHADCLLDTYETEEPYPIRMAWIMCSNPLAPTNSAEPDRWHVAMARSLDFAFGTDCFITPTIQATCEVFLPLSTVAEHDSVNKTHYGATMGTWGICNKAITVGEAKSDWEIMCDLAHRIGGVALELFPTPYDYLELSRLRGNYKFDEVKSLVKFKPKVHYRKYETGRARPDGQTGFITPTRRVELWSTQYANFGEDPLPYYLEPAFSAKSKPEEAEKYPFILMTGVRNFASFHSEHRQISRLREIMPNALVEINPEDARALGIEDGQWVRIENSFGSSIQKAKVASTVRKGQVMAHHGWWYPEEDGSEPNLFGVWRSNINTLVPNHYNNPLGYCAPYKCMNCNIVPLSENYDVDIKAHWDKFGKLV